MTETIQIKDMEITYTLTLLNKEVENELKRYGNLAHKKFNDSLVYHLILNLEDYYNKDEKYTISFVKGLYSYGYSDDLWEVALIRKKDNKKEVKGIKGNLTDEEVLKYTSNAYSQLKTDQNYYDKIPVEYYK